MEYSMELLYDDSDLLQNDSFSYNNITAAANASSVLSVPPLISAAMDRAISLICMVILFTTMISLGCTMEVAKIKAHIVRPKGVAIAVVAQYGVMPLTSFCLAKVFQLDPMAAVAVLICGCCPGGNISNVLALALRGDMNLSIVMTSCSTVLALGMMPLLLYLYCQGFSGLENAVPYGGIILALVMTLVPCGIGIVINYYKPQHAKIIHKVGMAIMWIACLVVGIMASVGIGGSIMTVLSPPLMSIAALMPFIGFTFGYVLSSIFRLNGSSRRTIAMETGCQNIQLCTTVLKVAFPPDVIGPLYIFPMVYIAFQLMEAGLLIVLFRCHQRFKVKEKEKKMYQPASTAPEQVKEKMYQPASTAPEQVKEKEPAADVSV